MGARTGAALLLYSGLPPVAPTSASSRSGASVLDKVLSLSGYRGVLVPANSASGILVLTAPPCRIFHGGGLVSEGRDPGCTSVFLAIFSATPELLVFSSILSPELALEYPLLLRANVWLAPCASISLLAPPSVPYSLVLRCSLLLPLELRALYARQDVSAGAAAESFRGFKSLGED